MTGGRTIPEARRAMPEWLVRKDEPTRAWTVQQGNAQRGDAWTNMTECEMRVPFGDDEISRLVRAHEMMHAKASPKVLDPRIAKVWGHSDEFVRCAEEFRINMLVGMAGFDVTELRDGSESQAGEIAAKNGDWNGAVTMLLACAGTKSGDDFVRGAIRGDDEFGKSLREVHKAIKKEWRAIVRENGRERANRKIASTEPIPTEIVIGEDESEVLFIPRGYLITKRLADFTSRFLRGSDAESDGEGEAIPSADEVKEEAKAGDRGRFARLIEKQIPKPRRTDGIIGRKRVATNVGRNPRRMNRMLTDPEKRVFDRTVRGKGGVVLIDQSGSMHFTEDQLWKIVEAAPGCVIIGYSHQAGSVNVPNVWVIADRGRVCDRGAIPRGNGGNGVDGPAIEFAQKRRLKGEPFIWVCDGMVTDGAHDSFLTSLAQDCYKKVVKYGIHNVGTVDEAISALKRAHNGSTNLPARSLVHGFPLGRAA
jgi:hypothetical protein